MTEINDINDMRFLVRRRMQELRISQADLSYMIDCAPYTVYAFLKNYHNTNIQTIFKILSCLNLKLKIEE